MSQSRSESRVLPPTRRNRPIGTNLSVATDRYEAEAWRLSAACLSVDPDMFFPIGSTGNAFHEIAKAKAVCAGCPVREACLAFAMATNQEFGVWGGQDEDERRRLRRQQQAAARAAAAASGR